MKSKTPPSRPLSRKLIGLILSNLTRWRILEELAAGEPRSVTELAVKFGKGVAAVSKHICVMREMGLVIVGRGRLYQLAPPFLTPSRTEIDLGECVLRFKNEAAV